MFMEAAEIVVISSFIGATVVADNISTAMMIPNY